MNYIVIIQLILFTIWAIGFAVGSFFRAIYRGAFLNIVSGVCYLLSLLAMYGMVYFGYSEGWRLVGFIFFTIAVVLSLVEVLRHITRDRLPQFWVGGDGDGIGDEWHSADGRCGGRA